MEKESLFLSYVRLTLKKWVGFQAALEEGMGGPYAKEKELWMGNEIENYFKHYSRVNPDDMEEYIGTMMENEFDSYFEDGSLLEISKNFCEAYELSIVNPNSPVFEEVLKLGQQLNPHNGHVRQSFQREEVNTEKSVAADMEQLNLNGTTGEEQWTVVTRRSHKK